MGQKNRDTAVLIFSFSAKGESERKTLFGSGKKRSDTAFFDILIRYTQKIAAAGGVETFFIDEGQQRGQTFGDRYANAFQDLFDRGYSKVVSIGNDSPELNAETLRKAIDAIQYKDMVVGPSTDGGLYLLGLSRGLFDAEEFLALPWQKDSLCDTLVQSSYWQQGGIYFLDALSDIDDTTSLLQFVRNTSDVFLADFILLHLSGSKSTFGRRSDGLFSAARPSFLTLRGPPSFEKNAVQP